MELASPWPVETERLRLRPLRERDTEAVTAYRSLSEVCRYVSFEPTTAGEIASRIAGRWGRTRFEQDGDGWLVGAALRADDRVIGDLSLALTAREHRGGEIGWVFAPESGGLGYATEAARALLGVGFEVCGLHRVVARIDARNEPSLALARRLGMRQEAHLRENEWFKGGWSDEIDFALLEHEWPAVRDRAVASA